MRLDKVNNTRRNIIYGLVWRLYITIMPFIIRTIFIYVLGVEYLGLDSLFVSILNVLSLAELGIGSALVFHMYKAIANDDKETICQLMSFYRKCYRIIGIIVLIIGSSLIPILKFLVKQDLPSDVNLYILYVIQLGATVVSYWLFAYKNCLLNAFQRNDLISKVNIALMTVQYIFQIVLLLLVKNYYYYIAIVPVINILKNIVTSFVVNKYYPDYLPNGKIPDETRKDIFVKVKALLFSKIGAIIVSSSDTIVISAFLGLKLSGIYSNYHYIITAVIGFISIIFESMTAGIGNSLQLDSIEKNYKEYKVVTLLNNWIIMFCSISLMCLFQPFVVVWLGEVYLLPTFTSLLLCVFFYFWKSNNVMLLYKDAKGLWHEDRFRPLIVGIINTILDLILVINFGINGVIIASISVYALIAIPWLFYNVHKHIFNNSPKEMVLGFFLNIVVTVLIGLLTYYACSLVSFGDGSRMMNGMLLLVKFFICLILPNILFILINIKNKNLRLIKSLFIKEEVKFNENRNDNI